MVKGKPREQAEREHRAKVKRNEDEVIAAALQSDPKDKSKTAEYVREVADDIIARRAQNN